MADDPDRPCRSRSEIKKTFIPIDGTKAVASAIPPKLTFQTSARLRAPSYAPRWITGGIPVGSYLASAVWSALRSPFAGRLPPRSHRPGLSLRLSAPATSLRHRFEALHLLVCIIRIRASFVKRAARKMRNFIRGRFVENAHHGKTGATAAAPVTVHSSRNRAIFSMAAAAFLMGNI